MSAILFWKHGQVQSFNTPFSAGDADDLRLMGCPCIDLFVTLKRPSDRFHRYGMFMRTGWKHMPLADMPKDFRVHLLLLNIAV